MIELSMLMPPPLPIDGSLLRPDALAMMSRGSIERVPLTAGPNPLRIGDLFAVKIIDEGNSAAPQLMISGDLENVDRLAAGMSTGSLTVHGRVGNLCGMAMTGGRLEIFGAAASATAAGFRGGELIIHGDVGDDLGLPLRGERRGISGGTIRVLGDCGDRCGYRMRRGTILITGSVGDEMARSMIAGTIAILGDIGRHAAIDARRGSILTRQPRPNDGDAERFTTPIAVELPFIELLLRMLPELRPAIARSAGQSFRLQRQVGDRTGGGQAEWLSWT